MAIKFRRRMLTRLKEISPAAAVSGIKVLSWVFALGSVILLAYLIFGNFRLIPEDWILYFNGRGPQAWFNSAVVLGIVFLIDAMTFPSRTIKTIMDVDSNSSWEKLLVACLFLLGIGGIIAYVITH